MPSNSETLIALPSPVRGAAPFAAAAVLAVAVGAGLLLRRWWRMAPAVAAASALVVAGHAATFVIAARAAGVAEPLFAGYRIEKSISVIERKNPGRLTRGDVLRIRITVRASGTFGAEVPPAMEFRLDGKKLHEWAVAAPLNEPKDYTHEFRIEKDEPVEVAIAFTNDFWDENYPDRSRRDRNLMVNALRITGPLDGPPPQKPKSHREIYVERKPGESDDGYALRVLNGFARRAFRRPTQEGEVKRYLQLVALAKQQGEDLEHGIRLALEAMLVSPSFLFREEPQPEPDDAEKIHRIDEHALATRLSYFFWSTMPDARLMELASRGELRKNLDAELERLLLDKRSRQLVSNFTGQWLRLRDMPSAQPGKRVFPKFDPKLRNLMRRETEMLFEHVLREDLPMTALLDADFTFINESLARHYGIPGVEGGEFRKVTHQDSRRRGILGHGSFHLLTSYPLRTSPVLRGKYVLENLLDTAPPPPPPNIPQLEPTSHNGDQRSLREQLEKHREDPSCASCHALMDPIGFGLENFDASGAWRDQENGKAIDASGELIGGRNSTAWTSSGKCWFRITGRISTAPSPPSC